MTSFLAQSVLNFPTLLIGGMIGGVASIFSLEQHKIFSIEDRIMFAVMNAGFGSMCIAGFIEIFGDWDAKTVPFSTLAEVLPVAFSTALLFGSAYGLSKTMTKASAHLPTVGVTVITASVMSTLGLIVDSTLLSPEMNEFIMLLTDPTAYYAFPFFYPVSVAVTMSALQQHPKVLCWDSHQKHQESPKSQQQQPNSGSNSGCDACSGVESGDGKKVSGERLNRWKRRIVVLENECKW